MIPAYYFPFIDLGSFSIPTYPLAHSMAYVIAGILILVEAKRRGADIRLVYNTIMIGFFGAVVGARLGGIIDNLGYFIANPNEIFNLGSGGWTESGGFILSFLLMILYLRRRNFSLLSFFDITAPAMALRFAVSRLGCGAIHDHIGKVMERPWPWGVEYEGLIRHETGLYSLFSNTIIFIILWSLRKRIKTRGVFFVAYLFMYSISIFIIRFFRAEDLPYVSDPRYLGLTATQYIAIVVLVTAILVYTYIRKHPVSVSTNPYGTPNGYENKK